MRYSLAAVWSKPPLSRLRPRNARLVLGLILLAAFGVRAWHAAYRLEIGRFWDERYAQANVRSIVETGSLRPVSSYYPSPVFNLPAAGVALVAQRLTGASLFDPLSAQRLTRSGYLLLRLLQCVYGTVAVGVLFLLGRRLFGPEVGLLAALALTFLPWHIRLSAYFKPDALLSLTVLLTLYASLRLLASPGWKWSIGTGLAIAAAMGSKLTGAVTAMPLGCVTLLWLRREPRRIAWTTLAGGVAAVAFVISNPYWRAYPAWLASLKRDYAMRAAWHEMSRVDFPQLTLQFLADPFTFGRPGAALALLGLMLCLLGALRARDRVRRAQLLVVGLFPLLWVAALATQTAYFKSNNLLPILAPLALLGIATLCGVWNAMRQRSTALRRPVVGATLAGLLAWGLVWPGVAYVHRSRTPSTLDAAYTRLGGTRPDGAGRLVWVEAGAVTAPPQWEESFSHRRRLGLARVPVDGEMSARRLALADARIVHAPARGGRLQDASRVVSEMMPASVSLRISPRFLRRRGPPLLVAQRPWRRYSEPIQLRLRPCPGNCRQALLSASGAANLHGSLTLWIATWPHTPLRMPRVTLGGRPIVLYEVMSRGDGRLLVGERFALRQDGLRLRIRDAQFPRRVAARLHLWLPPAAQ